MDEDTEEPILIDPTLVDLAAVIERADALICVLDARDPQAYRSKTLEEAGKPVVFVVTKTDLVPREALSAWLSHLRASMSAPVILFKAASAFLPAPAEAATKQKSAPAPSTTDTLGAKALHAALNGLKAKTVAVVGPANVGKSSLINSLAKRTIQPIYDLRTSQPGPSTTLRPTLITVPSSTSESLTFIDTAGFVSVPTTAPADSEDANRERVKDILLRARGRIERIKEPLPVTAVSTLVSRAPAEDLMLHFNLPAFAAGSTTAFLNTLSKAKNCLTKTSTPDHNAAARVVLRDWSTGAFAWYTTPSAVSEILLKPTPEDQEVLDAVLPRKELRRARGSLARLTPSEIETRATDLHAKSGAGTDVDGGDRANKRAKIVRDADDEDDEMSDDKFDGNEEEDEEEDVDNVDDGEYKEDDEPSGYESDNNDTPIDTPASRKRAAKAAPTPKGKTSGKKVSFAAIATKKSATQPKRVANTRSATAAAAKLKASGGDSDAYDFGSYFKN
ncbi:hypothetical protein BKA62DRAFT_741365 [Auriculariales sp. MPI-PUGE-AT-0066]|nr:hypothetical protein BKA62DRAFT_741365 [Auriculariales sp. MPI-PUGE-AT-0066]